jgi:integrase
MPAGSKTGLTEMRVRAAKPAAKPYKLFDAHQLYLHVSPSGGRHWRWKYRYDGREKLLSFGSYPLVSLAEARAKRDEARRLLADGVDPGVAKKVRIEANVAASRLTFEKVAREWHEINASQWAKIHAADVLRCFERDIFPKIGAIPLRDLTPPKILETLRTIEARSAIETAKRARQRVSAVFSYAIASGLTDNDPAEKVGAALKPLPRKGRQPAITDIKQLRVMLKAVDDDPARPVTRLALRLIAFTAVRPGELRGARWSEFEDLEGKSPLWRIPAARMKGDQDRKDEEGGDHLVPLAPQAVAVLRTVRGLTGSGVLVFPNSRHVSKPMSENALGYLLNRAGYHGRHVPHGFRAAFSTIMNEWAQREGRSDDRAVIDLMLAHVPHNKIEGAYNRAAYMERRRELAEIWADMISLGQAAPAAIATLKRRANLQHRDIARAGEATHHLYVVK